MFIVKATYRGETRKLPFPTYFTFPPFDHLCKQLCRVFPLSGGFTISRLLFSPNSNTSIRLLIGQKVHALEDYVRYIEPYNDRLWPDATLRFTIQDAAPIGNTASQRSPSHWTPPPSVSNTFNDTPSATPLQTPHALPMVIPPPPILFPSYTIPSVPGPKSTTNASSSSCCPIDDGKKEIQTLINNFVRDLNGVLARTFPPEETDTPHRPQRVGSRDFIPISQSSSSSQTTIPNAEVPSDKSSTLITNSQPVRSCPDRGKSSRPLPAVPGSMRAGHNRLGTSSRTFHGHGAACDLCDSGIRGVRYKCLVCPDFDTCESCFIITNEQHPNHSFVKIFDPAHYIHRPRPVFSHHATCNVCTDVISGARYKCLHPDCADFDLCDRCESHPIPLHPANHPMLKLKSTDIAVDIIQSTLTTGQAKPSSPKTNVSIAGSRVESMTAESPVNGGTQTKVVQLSKSDVDIQTSPQLETDINNWRSGFLPPEIQVASALNSPATRQRVRSGTATTLGSLPSNISDIRTTPIESPTTKEVILARFLGGDLVAEASMSFLIEREEDPQVQLMAVHVCDVTVPNGQTFPPGAEFVKSWRVRNNGTEEWPDTAELVFTGGDAMTLNLVPIPVGTVKPGAEIELSTRVLKAPGIPANYLGCWTLQNHGHGAFGDRLWVNINVVEQSESSVESLSSSSIIKMPQSVSQGVFDDKEPSPTSERLTDETLSDMGSSDAANVSLDGSDWQEFPTVNGEQEEYVILYDDNSSSDGN